MKTKFLVLVVAIFLPHVCPGADAPTKVFDGINYRAEIRKNPPNRLYWATIDLSERKISLHFSAGGPDPDGDGMWQTTLMRPTEIARREGFELTINGDFFCNSPTEPKPPYKVGQKAWVRGPAATNGKSWSTAATARPCLVVKKSGEVTMELLTKPSVDDAQVVGGNVMLVEDGRIVSNQESDPHPRTAVGLDSAGKKVTLLVVDGRRSGIATGMNYADLSREMLAAGCNHALNLDGGGSSVMVIRNGEKFEVKNVPSDKGSRERAVANVLGVGVKDAK